MGTAAYISPGAGARTRSDAGIRHLQPRPGAAGIALGAACLPAADARRVHRRTAVDAPADPGGLGLRMAFAAERDDVDRPEGSSECAGCRDAGPRAGCRRRRARRDGHCAGTRPQWRADAGPADASPETVDATLVLPSAPPPPPSPPTAPTTVIQRPRRAADAAGGCRAPHGSAGSRPHAPSPRPSPADRDHRRGRPRGDGIGGDRRGDQRRLGAPASPRRTAAAGGAAGHPPARPDGRGVAMKTRVLAFLAALALSAGVLAGCAPTPSEISSAVSTELQTTVVAIADAAAAGDAATALAELDQLQQQLDAALADGSVSAERAAAIQTRIDLVRADLQPVGGAGHVVEPAPKTPLTRAPRPMIRRGRHRARATARQRQRRQGKRQRQGQGRRLES